MDKQDFFEKIRELEGILENLRDEISELKKEIIDQSGETLIETDEERVNRLWAMLP